MISSHMAPLDPVHTSISILLQQHLKYEAINHKYVLTFKDSKHYQCIERGLWMFSRT
jgi:hypothetical protein